MVAGPRETTQHQVTTPENRLRRSGKPVTDQLPEKTVVSTMVTEVTGVTRLSDESYSSGTCLAIKLSELSSSLCGQ
jgi:hypothetical protein